MITTNTGSKKLESSDNWREIFPNSDLGTAGAHNASVDAADRIQAEVAPIINGKQCSVGAASGDYVLLRNSTITGKTDGAYVATKAIPANTDIDATYISGNPITGGISNELNSNITTLNNKFGTCIRTVTVNSNADYPTNAEITTGINNLYTSYGSGTGCINFFRDGLVRSACIMSLVTNQFGAGIIMSFYGTQLQKVKISGGTVTLTAI